MSSQRTSQQQLLIRSLMPRSGEALELGTVTVLVGPNNSGKTAVLHDILRLAAGLDLSDERQSERDAPQPVVLQDLSWAGQLTMDRLLLGLTRVPDAAGDEVVQGIGPDLATSLSRPVTLDVRNTLARPTMTARTVGSTALGQLMSLRVVYLDAPRRRRAVAGAAACSPQHPPESLLQLLQDAPQSLHDEFDRAVSAAFGLHVRLDATQRVHLELRVANQFPAPAEDALARVRQYECLGRLDQQGAGLLSYTAVVLTMLLCPGRVVLIDQPTESLDHEHARRLGAWISDHAADLSTQIVLASQDVSFLAGLFEGAADVTLLRLERREDTTRFHPISHEAGSTLSRHPLLSSQNSLDSLSYDGIVLVPNDTDRVVYQTVAELLLAAGNLRFLHCHGVENLRVVAQALGRLGLPLCVVAELDLLSDEKSFAKLVKAVTGSAAPQPWLATRERLAGHVEGWFDERSLSSSAHEVESFLDQLKSGGESDATGAALAAVGERAQKWGRLKRERLEVLPPGLRTWVEELLDELRQHGIFVSTKGDARAWMSDMLSFDEKKPWLIQTLEALRNRRCPAELQAFMADIVAHLAASRLPTRAARAGQRA